MSELGQQIAQVLTPLTGVRVAWFFGSRAKGTERADIADLRDVDSGVAFDAVAEGELVLERSKAERISAQVYVWKRYDDDAHRRQLFRKAALAAVERMTRDQR